MNRHNLNSVASKWRVHQRMMREVSDFNRRLDCRSAFLDRWYPGCMVGIMHYMDIL